MSCLLVLVELPGLVAHLGHLLGELVRRLLAELLAEVVQLPAGAGAFGEGLREPALLERLGGLADVLAALLDLLAGLGHAFAVLLALHPLAELVGVAEDLLLLVAEPLELPLDLLAWPAASLAASRADCSSLSRSFRSVCRWASSRSRLRTCRVSRCSCSLLRELLLLARAGSAPRSGSPRSTSSSCSSCRCDGLPPEPPPPLPLPRVAPDDLELAGAELEQRLVGGLLGGQGRA